MPKPTAHTLTWYDYDEVDAWLKENYGYDIGWDTPFSNYYHCTLDGGNGIYTEISSDELLLDDAEVMSVREILHRELHPRFALVRSW